MGTKAPVVPKIHKATDPLLPHLIFEWHPHTGKVYSLEIPGRWESGGFVPAPDWSAKARAVVIAEHCNTHALFLGFVQTFTRGMKKMAIDYDKMEGSELHKRAVKERLGAILLKGETNG